MEIILNRLRLHLNTFTHTILFVVGFSIIFIIGWGGGATAIGQVFVSYKSLLSRVGGVIIILLGLFLINAINIPWLNYEKRLYWQPGRGGAVISSLMMGICFAFGWTPCIGTTLGAILTLGMSRPSSVQAMVLASGYAVGLGIPFILVGFGMEKAVRFFARFRQYVRLIELISGGFLILLGILQLFDLTTLITTWALRYGLFLDIPLKGVEIPTYLVAIAAGLLSFFSPCVLPLLPAYLGYLSGSVVKNVQEERNFPG